MIHGKFRHEIIELFNYCKTRDVFVMEDFAHYIDFTKQKYSHVQIFTLRKSFCLLLLLLLFFGEWEMLFE